MRRKRVIEDSVEENESEFQAVFSDLMSFISGLFILLFTIVNSQMVATDYLSEMSIKFGGKKIEQKKRLTNEDLYISEIRNYIQDERLSQYMLMLVDEQKIRLIFNDPILFQSGTDQLQYSARAVLNGLIHIVSKVKNPVVIEGHTDHLPVKKGGKFSSNWDLGYFRASAVANYFISKGIKAKRLGIVSYGDVRPIATKKTAKGRKKNRRIEVNLIRVKKQS